MSIEIKADFAPSVDIKNLTDEMRSRIPKATGRALSRSITAGKSALWIEVRKTYNIKKADFYKYIKTDNKHNSLENKGIITVTGYKLNASEFKILGGEKVFTGQKGRPVAKRKLPTVALMTDKARRVKIPGTFARIVNNKPLVFRYKKGQYTASQFREMRKKGQIGQILVTIAAAEMINKYNQEAIMKRMREVFDQRLDHEIEQGYKYTFKKHGGAK
ncbi:MAG: hypothetical protein WCS30_00095 [Selenomonadaceae bacterium]